MIPRRLAISVSSSAIASAIAAFQRSGSSSRRAAESARRSAPSPCSVSSWSSRVQRRRSSSVAASRARSCSSVSERAVTTALAALTANELSSRSSSALNSPPSQRVERDEDSGCLGPERERDEQARLHASRQPAAEPDLLEAGAVLLVAETLRCRVSQRSSATLPRDGESLADERLVELAGRSGDPHAGRPAASSITSTPRADERATALGDQLQDGRGRSRPRARARSRRSRSSLPSVRSSSSRRLRTSCQAARVLDRDRRPLGEHHDGLPRRRR